MGNKPMKTVPFNYTRFKQAVKLRKMTIKEFCNPNGAAYKIFERDEKTLRRWKKSGTIPSDILDRISRFLDVDPAYISGKYDKLYEKFNDSEMSDAFKDQLRPDNFPYLLKEQSVISNGKTLYDIYLNSLLAIHHISIRQFVEMPFNNRKAFSLEIERAIVPVLERFFSVDARGRKGLQESRYLEAQIECFDPDEPEEK